LVGEEVSIATIWDNGSLTVYRKVMARRSPVALATLESRLGKTLGQGTIVPTDDETLAIIREAYREAAHAGTYDVRIASGARPHPVGNDA
jgi:hypothetical protein